MQDGGGAKGVHDTLKEYEVAFNPLEAKGSWGGKKKKRMIGENKRVVG